MDRESKLEKASYKMLGNVFIGHRLVVIQDAKLIIASL